MENLAYLSWMAAFFTLLYATGMRPWLLTRALINKANYGEFGQKSVILEDGFSCKKANSTRADIFITPSATPATSVISSSLSSQTPFFCTVPREDFADGGAEFLSEIKKRAGLDA